NSFSLTLILISLIGLPWTLVFIAMSMVIALITGWIFDRLVLRGVLPPNPYTQGLAEYKDFVFWAEAKKGFTETRFDAAFIKEMIVSGLRDSQMVVRWLLIGILLAGLLRAFISPDMFQHYFGPSLMGLVMTMILTTVIEVCSEGSTPIAADILTRAHAPGNGFAFLMAGVATDYTEIMVIKETTKSWKLALFLPLISAPQVFLVAWLMNNWGG
ncbi:MAG: permease, partial [Alphaproteobacteria bacterium]|nr:permease [Alphaproteobacteria bacterium]